MKILSSILCTAVVGFCSTVTSDRVKEENIVGILDCARAGLLYSVQGGGCHTPLSDADCKEKEMLVMGKDGAGVCVARQCNKEGIWANMYKGKDCVGVGEMLQYNVYGEVVCGCEEGWGKVTEGGSTCYQQETQGPCPEGYVVSSTSDECGRKEVCINYKTCPAYLALFNHLTTIKFSQLQRYKLGMAELKEKICDNKLKKICCKLPNSRDSNIEVSLHELENIILQFYHQSFKCSEKHPLLDLNTVVLSARRTKCGGGMVWSIFRMECVNLFGL